MSKFDKQIRDALKTEQDELYDEDEDFHSHLESLKTLFRGKLKWMTILHILTMCGMTAMIVVCAIQFFHVESMRAMIGWATGFVVFVVTEAVLELLFMMEWDKYVIRREVKQIELQVACLIGEIREQRIQPENLDDPDQIRTGD